MVSMSKDPVRVNCLAFNLEDNHDTFALLELYAVNYTEWFGVDNLIKEAELSEKVDFLHS